MHTGTSFIGEIRLKFFPLIVSIFSLEAEITIDFIAFFLLERRSKRSCAVLPQKYHNAFVCTGKWPLGAEETQMGSSSNCLARKPMPETRVTLHSSH